MFVVDFNKLIIRIFKSHGFEINSTSNYSKYILATKDNINLSVGYIEPGEEPNVGNLRNFVRSSKKDNADRLIYILPESYPDNIDKFANDRNIQLWDRERLEREIGRAVVTDLNKPETKDEIAEELGDMVSSTSETESDDILDVDSDIIDADTDSVDETIPIMVPVVPIGDFSDSETSTSTEETIIETDTEPQSETGATAEVPEIKKYRIIKPIVSKDDASSMASKIVRGFRFNLELVPYYIFDFTCKFDIDDNDENETYGMLGINGLTSNVEEWPTKRETVRYLDEKHTKLEVKFPYDKALTIAQQAVINLNTKMIETREEHESTVIFEKKKLEPKPDAIILNSRGIHYLPVWCIEGSNGLMIIDAASNKIIKEEIFKTPGYVEQDQEIDSEGF
jgi:hypothetical protein